MSTAPTTTFPTPETTPRGQAITTLLQLLNSPEPQIRLEAARLILENP